MTDALGRLKAALSDRYTIERELGAGGTATAYLAYELKHELKSGIHDHPPTEICGASEFSGPA